MKTAVHELTHVHGKDSARRPVLPRDPFIGRLTASVPAGGWINVHNLLTTARHETAHEHAWYDAAESPAQLRALGTAQCHVGESPVFDASCNRLYWIDVRETPAIHALDL